MALPDYSGINFVDTPTYKSYKQWYEGPKKQILSLKQFKKGKKNYKPPAQEGPVLSVTSPTSQPSNSPGRDYSAHPFFDPNANYSTRPGSQQALTPGTTPYNYYASEESPEGYYYSIMNQQGFGGMDARSLAAQGMYRDYARGYQAAKLQNHDLWFPEYMGMQDVAGTVRNLSNRQLGIDEGLYGGRDRWSLRGY